MPPEEHRPISDRNPPIALAGVAIGLVVASITVVVVKTRPPPTPASVTVEVPRASSSSPAARSAPPAVPAPPRHRPSPLPTPVAVPGSLPPNPGGHTGSMEFAGVHIELATSEHTPAEIAAYYEAGFGRCARAWHKDDVDVVRCGTDTSMLTVIVMPKNGGSAISAETVALQPVSALGPRTGSAMTMCSRALRFLALPDDASGRSSNAGTTWGRCELTMRESPSSTLNELGARIAGSLNSFDVTGDRTLEAIAMNSGVYWQIDVTAGSDGGSHVVIQRIDTERVPSPPVPRDAVQALREGCSAPCVAEALAIEGVPASAAADRCMFECAGEPGAPARVAPFDAFMPTHPQ